MKGSILFKRNGSFLLLAAAGVGLAFALRQPGMPSDIQNGVMFVPPLVLFIWNRSTGKDRFYGMALPTAVFMVFASITGVSQNKMGTGFEFMNMIGLLGVCASLLWIFALISTMFGPPSPKGGD